jgi:hypothetical protein
MTRSANEVMGLATKAARGSGAPPAQAAQFGAAAVIHLSAGHDVAALDAALAALPEGPIMTLPVAIARITETQVEGIAYGAFGDGAMAQSYVAALPCQANLAADGILHVDLNRPAARRAVQRIDLSTETDTAWRALAAKLLVPESDASRQSGAGAGLTDND